MSRIAIAMIALFTALSAQEEVMLENQEEVAVFEDTEDQLVLYTDEEELSEEDALCREDVIEEITDEE